MKRDRPKPNGEGQTNLARRSVRRYLGRNGSRTDAPLVRQGADARSSGPAIVRAGCSALITRDRDGHPGGGGGGGGGGGRGGWGGGGRGGAGGRAGGGGGGGVVFFFGAGSFFSGGVGSGVGRREPGTGSKMGPAAPGQGNLGVLRPGAVSHGITWPWFKGDPGERRPV